MIITVTMNPAIDKTIDIEKLVPGALNRITHVEQDIGGKGINVSKTIRELGGKSIAVGFLAGNAGNTIEKALKAWNIETDFVYVQGETRTNTKVVESDGTLTELNEAGPEITEAQLQELFERLDHYAAPDALFVLSGSVPKGISKDIYAQIIRRVHEKGALVLMDADGELFRKGMEAGPDMIKPNKMELETYIKEKYSEESSMDFQAVLDGFLASGVQKIVLSMGGDGAVFYGQSDRTSCPAMKVRVHSTVGAGDAMVASMALAWEQGLVWEEYVRLCMAASAGAVMTIGTKPPSSELVESLKKDVIMNDCEG